MLPFLRQFCQIFSRAESLPATACIAFLLFAPLARAVQPTLPPSEYRPDRILVKPGPGADSDALAALHSSHNAKVVRTFNDLGRIQVLQVPLGETVSHLIAQYEASGLVEFAEPDYLAHLEATMPNDPKFTDGTLWGLYNYGQNGGTPHADIDAIDAWDVLTSASNIVVAIVDSGVRFTHTDLASNMWVSPIDGGHGFNAVNTNTPNDDAKDGHGTLMAGVIGAEGNNGIGVVGVAWQVQMMACKAFDSNEVSSDSDIIACLDFARTNGAKVINASFSSAGFSTPLSNAIVATRDAGIIFVTSAGNVTNTAPTNLDVNPRYPACYAIDNIVAVAYTTRNDTLGSLSNYGATNVALAAPGDSIYSTYNTSDTAYYPTFLITLGTGTSYAAAYTSGAFALMLAKYPAETYQQIISRVLNAVDPLPSLAGKCSTGGRLNLRKALSPPLGLKVLPSAPTLPVQMRLTAGPRRSCVIQVSTNLGAWSSVFTNTTSDAGTFDFTDSQSTNAPQRFYRAVSSL